MTVPATTKQPAIGISHRLRTAGHTRHAHGQVGYKVHGSHSAEGTAWVWHCDRYGNAMPAGAALQAYGRTLADLGYHVAVLDLGASTCLVVHPPAAKERPA